MFRPIFPIFALCAIALTACTVDENGNIVPSPSTSAGSSMASAPRVSAMPRMSQAGTCFMFVTNEAAGKYTLTTGIGDGSANPLGQARKGLSAARTDALYASELAVMNISPECLAVLATDRTAARPMVVASAAKPK